MHKYFLILSLILPLFILSSCNDDPDPDEDLNILKVDGENENAVFLPVGTYKTAVRFTAAELVDHQGKKLTGVEFYIQEIPVGLQVKVYQDSNGDAPLTLAYTSNDINALTANNWNTHTLNEAVDITDNDLWLSLEFEQDQDQRSIGCDAGPAALNGEWIWDNSFVSWDRLQNRVQGIDINWNIRGKLTE